MSMMSDDPGLTEWIAGLLDRVGSAIRPVCPECKGEGWFVDYWGEGTGCHLCNSNEDREELVVRIWFWEIWRDMYHNWRRDRWVDQQIAKDKDK
jgi:hypothetical protein